VFRPVGLSYLSRSGRFAQIEPLGRSVLRPANVEFTGPIGAFVRDIRAALLRHRLVVTAGVGVLTDPRPFWDEVTESLGTSVLLAEDWRTGRKIGEKWMEIRYDPTIPNAYRHTSEAQPLHTDGSYLQDAPQIISFYCLKQAASGGETVFVDGPELVALLMDEDRGLFSDVTSIPVMFSKAGDSKTRPIVQLERDLPRLTWNYFAVDAAQTPEVKDVAERFHRFLQERVVRQGRVRPVLLAPGEAVFFHDERVLHGRNGFVARRPDDRFLWKTGITLAKP
jgi:alpha-ketoglutarate-dependent taurine dioxygenase